MTTKLNVLVNVLNNILDNMQKSQITKLTEFNNIKKKDLICNTNKQIIEQNYAYIFKYFKKTSCQFYQRNKIKNYIITLLKEMCKDVGYIFKSSIIVDVIEFNGEKYKKKTTYYSINLE
jgi:hypothetical protein